MSQQFPIEPTVGDAQRAIDEAWMRRALEQAALAASAGEVPVGAIVVRDGVALGSGFNCPISTSDPTAHAEVVALRAAALHDSNYRLPGTTLYVTIEPCTMCIGAMMHARIERLVYGAPEPRAGSVISAQRMLDAEHFNHRIGCVAGVLDTECAAVMQEFFRARRGRKG